MDLGRGCDQHIGEHQALWPRCFLPCAEESCALRSATAQRQPKESLRRMLLSTTSVVQPTFESQALRLPPWKACARCPVSELLNHVIELDRHTSGPTPVGSTSASQQADLEVALMVCERVRLCRRESSKVGRSRCFQSSTLETRSRRGDSSGGRSKSHALTNGFGGSACGLNVRFGDCRSFPQPTRTKRRLPSLNELRPFRLSFVEDRR